MTQPTEIFRKYPGAEEIFNLIRYELQQARRPPHEVILSDEQVLKMLTISKRKLQYLRSDREIGYSKKVNRYYHTLQDILNFLNSGRVEPIQSPLIKKS